MSRIAALTLHLIEELPSGYGSLTDAKTAEIDPYLPTVDLFKFPEMFFLS